MEEDGKEGWKEKEDGGVYWEEAELDQIWGDVLSL